MKKLSTLSIILFLIVNNAFAIFVFDSPGNVITISTPTQYYEDIHIARGTILEIKSTIQMYDFKRITVEQGGYLVIDGGKITNRFDDPVNKEYWAGIAVLGSNGATEICISSQKGTLESYSDFFSNYSTKDYGMLVIKNNSTIANSFWGVVTNNIFVEFNNVKCFPWTLQTNSGGYINIKDCSFKENLYSSIYLDKVSTTFEGYKPVIDNCSFTFSTNKTVAWHTIETEAQITVNQYGAFCHITNSTFDISGLHKNAMNGVKCHNTYAAVSNNTFINCQMAVVLRNQNLSTFKNNSTSYSISANTIYTDVPTTYRQIHCQNSDKVYISGNKIYTKNNLGFNTQGVSMISTRACESMIVLGNQITNNDVYNSGDRSAGITIVSSGKLWGEVKNNKLTNLGTGIAFDASCDGTKFRCNNFTNNKIYDALNYGVIHPMQDGDVNTRGASNIFNSTTLPLLNLDLKFSATKYAYFYYNNNTFHNPVNYNIAITKNLVLLPKLYCTSHPLASMRPTGENNYSNPLNESGVAFFSPSEWIVAEKQIVNREKQELFNYYDYNNHTDSMLQMVNTDTSFFGYYNKCRTLVSLGDPVGALTALQMINTNNEDESQNFKKYYTAIIHGQLASFSDSWKSAYLNDIAAVANLTGFIAAQAQSTMEYFQTQPYYVENESSNVSFTLYPVPNTTSNLNITGTNIPNTITNISVVITDMLGNTILNNFYNLTTTSFPISMDISGLELNKYYVCKINANSQCLQSSYIIRN